jgi:hypothetical protein
VRQHGHDLAGIVPELRRRDAGRQRGLAPATCPKDVSTQLAKNDVPGAGKPLVPDDPTGLVLCGGKDRVVVDDVLVPELASLLNGQKRVPSPNAATCTRGTGPVYGLYFTYPDGACSP